MTLNGSDLLSFSLFLGVIATILLLIKVIFILIKGDNKESVID